MVGGRSFFVRTHREPCAYATATRPDELARPDPPIAAYLRAAGNRGRPEIEVKRSHQDAINRFPLRSIKAGFLGQRCQHAGIIMVHWSSRLATIRSGLHRTKHQKGTPFDE